MSTTTQMPQRPTQEQVDRAARNIQQAASSQPDRQAQLDAQTQDTLQNQADAQEQQAQARRDAIATAARAQRSIVQARQEEVRQGDHVVIDIDRVPEALHTVTLRERLQHLFQRGAHQVTGRVQRIEDTPHGREAIVETANATYPVPMAAVVRADLYEVE